MSWELDQVRVVRGGRFIVDEVSLRPESGRVTAVLGMNGAGKSSLVRLLSGEWRPDTGEVRWRGRPLYDCDPREVARSRAVVNQDADLRFGFRVREVVEMGRFAHGDAGGRRSRQRVDAVLEELDLTSFVNRQVPGLSGGERRRVMLARALVQLAEAREQGGGLLVLDEPTAHLDLRHQERLLTGIRRWADAGLGIFVVLHDINHAARVADRVLVMRHGRAADEGPAPLVLKPERLERWFDVRFERIRRPGRPDHWVTVPSDRPSPAHVPKPEPLTEWSPHDISRTF